MFEVCYPHQASSQPRDEQKPLEHRFCGHFDDDSRRAVAFRSWKHVLTSTGGNEEDTRKSYKEAVARVETEARAVYVEDSRSKDEFLQVMTEQGCFILLVVFCSLGGPKPLGCPSDDPFFGENRWDKEQIRGWVNSMFSVTKQIPLVVLKVLMKQSFFQNVLKLGKWKRPNDLARMVLYDFLVEPAMLDDPVNHGNRSSMRRLVGFFNKRIMNPWHHHQEPTTPLHALWLLLTGSGSHGANNIEEEDECDLYTTLSTVRSAMVLLAAGITFKSGEGIGTRQIKFKQRMLEAHLYLPSIYMEPDTMALFQNLIDYDAAVGLDRNQCEISAYLSFMKELIRSLEDVKVLVTQGIIDTDPKYEEQLPDKLSKLDTLEVGKSHNLVAIRLQICRYVKPSIWPRIMNLIVIGVVITLVQTIDSALSYHHPHNS